MSSATDDIPDYVYIRQVTLGQFFTGLKSLAGWWLGLFIATIVFGLLFDQAKAITYVHYVGRMTLLRRITRLLESLPRAFWIGLRSRSQCGFFEARQSSYQSSL